MKKGKKGQFYLIAAIAIITLALGVILVYNYSDQSGGSRVKELAQELQTESSKVLNYQDYSSDYKIEEFTQNFSEYAGKRIEIIYLIGEESNFQVYRFDELGQKQNYLDYVENAGTVSININSSVYNFELREGQNFYFIMYQQEGGNKYVETN